MPDMWIGSRCLVLLLLACSGAGCSSTITRTDIIGHYDLKGFEAQPDSTSADLKHEELDLLPDGSFRQICYFRSTSQAYTGSGSWSFSDKLTLHGLRNCSGLGPVADTFGPVVEGPPTMILLHPDLSVYYRRRDPE